MLAPGIYLEGRGQLGRKKWKEQMQEFSWLGSGLGDGTRTARSNDVAVCTLILLALVPSSGTSVPKEVAGGSGRSD